MLELSVIIVIGVLAVVLYFVIKNRSRGRCSENPEDSDKGLEGCKADEQGLDQVQPEPTDLKTDMEVAENPDSQDQAIGAPIPEHDVKENQEDVEENQERDPSHHNDMQNDSEQDYRVQVNSEQDYQDQVNKEEEPQ
jgi:hypothetical protein